MSNSQELQDVNDNEQNKNLKEIPGSSNNASYNQNDLEKFRSFMFDGFALGSSPPKFVSLEEIKKATKGLQNMALAHEIAVNNNFRIEHFEPEKNTLQSQVKEIMHKAFWDILRDEISSNPPIYTRALELLNEIKESLYELLQPEFLATKNTALKERISEVLDTELIRQQLEKGELVFDYYAQFVINIMSKICAPVRDEKIKQLNSSTDVVETFKEIMETLQLMKLDLANFTIRMMRPNIVASSIEYEKSKFADFLKIQNDGLKYTKLWLLKNLTPEKMTEAAQDSNSLKQVENFIIIESYLDLLEFDNHPNAETLMLDQARFVDLRNNVTRLTLTASILLLLKPLLDRVRADTGVDDVDTIKKNILPLLDTVSSNKELQAVTPNILVQVKAYIENIQQNTPKITEFAGFTDLMSVLENNILELYKNDLPIRKLVTSRVRQFLSNIIISQALPEQIPLGIQPIQKELTALAAQFLIVIKFNKNVFGGYYQSIIENAIMKES